MSFYIVKLSEYLNDKWKRGRFVENFWTMEKRAGEKNGILKEPVAGIAVSKRHNDGGMFEVSSETTITEMESMTADEVMESQREWWQTVYSTNAIMKRVSEVQKQIAVGNMEDWLTDKEADNVLRENLQWLK